MFENNAIKNRTNLQGPEAQWQWVPDEKTWIVHTKKMIYKQTIKPETSSEEGKTAKSALKLGTAGGRAFGVPASAKQP